MSKYIGSEGCQHGLDFCGVCRFAVEVGDLRGEVSALKAEVSALRAALAADRAAFADIKDTGCSSDDHFSLRDRAKPRECPQVGARRRITAIDLLDLCGHKNNDGRGCATCAEIRAQRAKTDPTPCETCRGAGKVLHFYARGPGDAPGNRMGPCPTCAAPAATSRQAKVWCDQCGIPVSASGHTHVSQKGKACCAWHFTGGDGPQCLDEMFGGE
jgi:hypothetical protein